MHLSTMDVTNRSKRSLERVTIFEPDGKLPVQVFLQHSISPESGGEGLIKATVPTCVCRSGSHP
jgi:hypothetical protein